MTDAIEPTDEQREAAIDVVRLSQGYDGPTSEDIAQLLAGREAKHLADIAMLRRALHISGTYDGDDFVAQGDALAATDHYEVKA